MTSTALSTLQAVGMSVGYLREIQTAPADFDCPVHDVPVNLLTLDTINGWQSAQVCPADDGTCPYHSGIDPDAIDPPEQAPTAPTGEADPGF